MRWAVAVLLVLCAGLVPVWALSVQTPFRLIDDYGACFEVWDRTVWDHVMPNLLLGENQGRFRPTYDVGQLLAFGLFGPDYRGHHALRLLLKVLAFAALFAFAVRHVEESAGAKLGRLERWVLAGLAVSLFFYFPNNPEARLTPQELPTVIGFMGCLFFLTRRSEGLARSLDDGLGLLCFAWGIWSKEPNVIPGAALLALVLVEKDAWRGRLSRRAFLLLLGYIVVWAHAVAKVAVLSVGGGYGRSPLDWNAELAMAREVPRQVLLAATAWWMPALFGAGLASFAWLGIRRSSSPAPRRRSALLVCLLAASVAQYVLLRDPVLRYAYPATAILVLVTAAGFGLLLARAPTAAALRRRGLATAGLALAFALAAYRDMTVQFSTQYVAGWTETTMLDRVERLMAAEPGRSFFAVWESEYDRRVAIYFNRHLPYFFGRRTRIGFLRSPAGPSFSPHELNDVVADVPAGGSWVTRRSEAPGFETVVEVPPRPEPRIVAISTALSRVMRLGNAGPEPLLDAGAPPLLPESWFVLRRTAGEAVRANGVVPPARGAGAGSSPAPAR